MIDFAREAAREAAKAALYSRRKRMGKAARRRKPRRVAGLYPRAAERGYAAAIRSLLGPMIRFVAEYLENNHEAVLRGDSAALTRTDAVPGGSYRRMVSSLYGWLATYLPPLGEGGSRPSPPVAYLGLGAVADGVFGFNSRQAGREAKAALGVEFPVRESWWPELKLAWAQENYHLIGKMSGEYIGKVSRQAELAVVNGWSHRQLAAEIRKIDAGMTGARANLLARDQIGKLNALATQARMEASGLKLYRWSTMNDERVRGRPEDERGVYPNARPSHYELDGKICRWDDPAVYSEDGGKTWQPRPGSWSQSHPGMEVQCRCLALSFWDELIGEVDAEIDAEEAVSGAWWEAGKVNDPGISGSMELGPNYDKEKVDKYLNRVGEKIESVDAEMKLIHELGINANGAREYMTIYAEDGTIIHTGEGTEPGKIYIPKRILDLLDSSPKARYNLIHNHVSGESFSLDDLTKLVYHRAINSVMAIGHNGRKYTMSIAGGRIPTIERLTELYNEKEAQYLSFYLNRKAQGLSIPDDANVFMRSLINLIIKNEFVWIYEEGWL